VRPVIVGVQAEQHDHVRPEVVAALQVGCHSGAAFVRAEPAVGLAAVQGALDPGLRLLDHALVFQQIGAADVALEPIGDFLPAAVAAGARIEPGVVVFFEKTADVGQMAVKPLSLKYKLLPQPPGRPHRSKRQSNHRARLQRRAVGDIVGVAGAGIGPLDRLDGGGSAMARQYQGAQGGQTHGGAR